MSILDKKSILRREQDVIDRLENVKRLIQMRTTLLTVEGAQNWRRYHLTNREGVQIGDDLYNDLNEEIQMQLLSIVALCYGDNPDLGEPSPMLCWKESKDFISCDRFREVWEECLEWNA